MCIYIYIERERERWIFIKVIDAPKAWIGSGKPWRASRARDSQE